MTVRLVKEEYNEAIKVSPAKVPNDLELICMVSASEGGGYDRASLILNKVNDELIKKAEENSADFVFGVEYKIVPLFIASTSVTGIAGAINSNYILLAQGDAYKKKH